MAFPTIQYGSLAYSGAELYSNEKNQNSFIRVNGDIVSGQNTITNVVDVAGFFGLAEAMVGMVLVSSGEFSGDVIITDISGDIITVDTNAIANGSTQLCRIRPPKGMYFFESASFSKVGSSATNKPTDLRDVTGSEDPDYDAADLPWGILAPLSSTGSVDTTSVGLYGQYTITKIQSRISTTKMNFFATASNSLPSFIENSGSQISAGKTDLMLSQIDSNLMTIAGADDLGAGGQGLALAAYQTAVGSIIATLTSGSDIFPFSGSAQITGSLSVTGSSTISLDASENFLINNTTAPTQSLFQINDEGVAVFRARADGDAIPTAVVGGMYFSASGAFIGIE
jgi:hypothetical protein